nr:MAG TPA: hypothetical protein [Caudoviricetes sp.]
MTQLKTKVENLTSPLRRRGLKPKTERPRRRPQAGRIGKSEKN